MNHYDTLGVGKNASPKAIKQAYRKRAHQLHPDKGGSNEKFQAVRKAWEVLGNANRRLQYDQTGDDRPAADPMNQAMMELAGCLLVAIQNAPDVDHADIRAMVTQQIMNGMSAKNQQKQQLQAQINRLKRAMKRIKKKSGGDNFLIGVCDAHIRQQEHGIAKIDSDLQVGEEMLKLLSDYEYQFDAGQQQAQFFQFMQLQPMR